MARLSGVRRLLPCCLALLACLALLGGCAATESDPSASVSWLVQHGRYEEAVVLAARRSAERPGDAQAAEHWRKASVALLLSEGRGFYFENRDVEALEKFDAALALDPEVPQCQQWRDATLDKLAQAWVVKASEWHAADNLDEAVAAYEQALVYRPTELRATQGLARALLQLNYRRGMGEKYYQSGVEALSESYLDQAVHDFDGTSKYDPANESAPRRRGEANTMRAEARTLVAEGFEDEGAFAAARNEFRIATLLDPRYAPALAGLERARQEERAAEFLREADRRILRGQFAEAQVALDAGRALTVRQLDLFDAELGRLETARLTERYAAARALEADHRYEAAVVAFDALLASAAEGYFLDVIARRDTLQDFIEKAGRYYQAALAESEPVQQLNLLKQVQVVYPEYRDTQVRIDALQAQLSSPPDAPRD